MIYKNRGMSLIEVIIYSALLSLLMTTSVAYAYSIHEQNMNLMLEIHDEYK
jgi:Tfp pilus assembly protein PilE